jgi:hypothetical protein
VGPDFVNEGKVEEVSLTRDADCATSISGERFAGCKRQLIAGFSVATRPSGIR